MDHSDIVNSIQNAKDSFGVLPPENAKDWLNNFTAADWQEAAKTFAPNASHPDGFSITDTNGQISIHNDLSEAHNEADNSILHNTIGDVKGIGALVAGGAGLTTLHFGLMGYVDTMAAGGAVADGAAAGLAAAGAAVTGIGEIAAAAVGVMIVGDYAVNAFQKLQAKSDIKNDAVVNFKV
jgi:hypothetical protein